MELKKVLSIAGSDCSGGAGIQADIKTISKLKAYAMSVITSITAQNTLKVSDIVDLDSNIISNQLDAIFNDIVPDAIKIGMVNDPSIIKTIYDKLKSYNAKNIVVDPVMISSTGFKLLKDESIESLKKYLFEIATLITPNIYEAEVISNKKINNEKDMEDVAKIIFEKYHCAVLIKGGHLINSANDLLIFNNQLFWFKTKKINNKNTHGTGCTLSSAIATFLAKDGNIIPSIKKAKRYLTKTLKYNIKIGNGIGPVNHLLVK